MLRQAADAPWQLEKQVATLLETAGRQVDVEVFKAD